MFDINDELTPEEKFAAEDAESMVPRALSQGKDPEDVVAELIRLDWTPQAARALVERVSNDLDRFHTSPESRQELLTEAKFQMMSGLIMALMGAGSVLVFLLVPPLLFLPIGLWVLGMILASRGWTRWRLYRKEALPFEEGDKRE